VPTSQVFTALFRKSNPIAGLHRPWGFQEVEAPRSTWRW